MSGARLSAGFCVGALCALTACGPATPPTPPPPIAPSAAQIFLSKFAAAETKVEPALRVTARDCAPAGRFYSCALTTNAPPPSVAPSPMRLTLMLNGAIITGTTVEAAPADAATQFATLSAIAAANGEPLNTPATIAAFKRDLGFGGKPKPGRAYLATRSYGAVTCVLDERGVNACTVTPLVAAGDLPAPVGAVTRERGVAR